MTNKEIIEKIRDFLNEENQSGENLISYKTVSDPPRYFNKFKIGIGLEQYKEIILQEETKLELGGINKKSFCITYPLSDLDLIEDGRITLLGPEIHEVLEETSDFGIFILIGINKISEKERNNLGNLSFISNSIEGFIIRTIPRRFWCRINSEVIKKKFSFEFLGNAICHLYKLKFKELIKSIEIFLICSNPNSIETFIQLSSAITTEIKEKWKAKIDEWRKRIDCEYDWGCEICPYQEECYDIKNVLIKREQLDYKM